jgi:O-antigen ligase
VARAEPEPPASPLAPLLEATALVLLSAQLVMRLLVYTGRSPGFDFLLNGLILLGAGVYFAARALGRERTLRFSGLELPLLAFVLLVLLSVHRASYRFPALQTAFGWTSGLVLFVVLTDLAYRRGVARLFTILSATGFVILIYAALQHVAMLPQITEDLTRQANAASEGLLHRARSGQPFGTFVLPNTLAGFIAILLPMMVASIVEARALGRDYWMSPTAVMRGTFVVLSILVLAWTESRGGWVATLGGLATLAVLAAARRRLERRLLALAAAALAAVAAAALWAGGYERLRKVETFGLRADGYWPAAGRMIREAPWRGVGLRAYEDHYTRLKGEIQTEVRTAHSDYLQIAAEIGLPGACCFGLIWLVALWRGARGDEPTTPPERAPPDRRALPAMMGLGAVAFALAVLLGDAWPGTPELPGPSIALAMLACWIAWVGFSFRAQEAMDAAPRPLLGLGAMGGIVAFLIHAGVDNDFYDLGIAQVLFVTLAILSTRAVRVGFLPMPRPAAILLSGGCLIFAAFVLGSYAPPIQESDALKELARAKWEQARRLPSDDPKREDLYEEAQQALWERAYPQAQLEQRLSRPGAFDLNDQDAETLWLIAGVYFHQWESWARQVQTGSELDKLEERGLYDLAEEAIDRIIVKWTDSNRREHPPLRELWAEAWFEAGRMAYRRFEVMARMTILLGAGKYEGIGNSSLTRALRCFTRSAELYPTLARNQAWLARVNGLKMRDASPREISRWRSGAVQAARRALELDERVDARREPGLKLTDEERSWIDQILKE